MLCFAVLCAARCQLQASNPITPFPACFFLSRLAGLVGAKETREMQRDERRVRQVPSSEFETACAGLACAAHRMSYLFCSLFSTRVKWSF